MVDKHFSFQNYDGAKKFITQHSRISYEVQNSKKKKTRCGTETNLREETKADAVNQEDKREDPENLDKLHTSQSHYEKSEYQVDQLTPHIKELQDVVNTVHDAQDFQDLDTASCSVSIHIPSVQAVFRVFLVIAAQAETFENTEVRQSTGQVYRD